MCKWENGRARLKTTNNLPDAPHEVVAETPERQEDKVYPSHVKIPQPNGIDLPIRTHELEDAVKTLGFYHSLDASKSDHVKKIIKKRIDYVDRTNTGKLPRRYASMSFFAQLLPGINRGLVAVVLTPKALQKYYQDLYYKILPLLGVNRNMGKEWRTLPERYQGLDLLDF